MCGVAGYVGTRPGADALALVTRMLDAQSHRGPDDSGAMVWCPRSGANFSIDRIGDRTPSAIPDPRLAQGANTVALGCRRLAIIDRTNAGHQPMTTADGACTVVFNGEIYNHIELRAELAARGHRFRGRSDTEVLLAAYREWNVGCLNRFVGMFTFLIADWNRRRVVIARDPFGMKPCYFVPTPDGVHVASEILPLLEVAHGPPRLRRALALDYLRDGLTDHTDHTLFDQVWSLPPAHFAEIDLQTDASTIQPRCYWRLDPSDRNDVSFHQAVKDLREIFLRAIELHARSDVAVGVMLSGGLDSSAIAVALREVLGARADIHAFSYVGDLDAINETPWIDSAIRASGAISHRITLTAEEWDREVDAVVRTQGEPFGSAAIYAQFRLYRLAHEMRVPVVLGGQGADELWAGYHVHLPAYLGGLTRRLQVVDLWRVLRSVRTRDGGSAARWHFRQMMRTLVPSWLLARGPTHRGWLRSEWFGASDVHGNDHHQVARLRGLLRRNVQRELPMLLRFEDRNAMAWSVEGRLPFLTTELASFALALPDRYLIDPAGRGKRVLREALRPLLPDQILERDKLGFSVPSREWPRRSRRFLPLLETAQRWAGIDPSGPGRLMRRIQQGELGPHQAATAWRIVGYVMWSLMWEVSDGFD